MECCSCEYMKPLINSEGRMIYFCVNVASGAYLSETDDLGDCDWEPQGKEQNHDNHRED